MYKKLYDSFILKYPFIVLFLSSLLLGYLIYNSKNLQIDASAETLLLEDDEDLKFFRQTYKKYDNSNFLIVTFTPNDYLLAEKTLKNIKNLSKDFLKIKTIKKVDSILNVPLLQSPVRPISDLLAGVDSLSTKDFDKSLVEKEFLTSPLYKNALVSNDFKTTALILHLKNDDEYFKFLDKRKELLEKQKNSNLTKEENKELQKILEEFKIHKEKSRLSDKKSIEEIRHIIKNYETEGKIFLGGVNMIASDVIGFIKNDLIIYGLSLLFLFILILWLIFKSFRWVFITLFICSISIASTTGILGLFSWEVSVISSNFVALQLIITMSIVVHLIERYKELYFKYKKASQYKLVINTTLSKLIPSFFAILTTIVGFSSLVLSKIEPVINLGLMMSVGILVSLFIAFIFIPIFLMLVGKRSEIKKDLSAFDFISQLPKIIIDNKNKIFFISFFIFIFSIFGSSKIFVENSFINYFKASTQIYKGMKVIDENLGGTTPLDIIIKFNDKEVINKTKNNSDFDDFEAEFTLAKDDKRYWFTQDKMQVITKIHDYLESIPEIGKVQSLATLLKIGKTLNKDKDLDAITLALIYNQLPEEYKKLILSPFVNIEENEARITMRIIDSNENLRRNDLLQKIKEDIKNLIPNKDISFRLTNLMVLYNNMLQSLFDSQIATAGTSILVLAIMFFILFRKFKLVFITLTSNLIPISLVFGIMGYLAIPLDIMTITIAAIALGIAVDDTIHFIHRFEFEYKKSHSDYELALHKAINTVAYPMYHTSVIVVIGFSILVLSNLIPTIYFGFLTALVMISVLISNLILLPRLILSLKPYKKEKII